MTIYSVNELALRAARKLMFTSNVSAEDIQLIADKIDGCLDGLRADEIYYASGVEAITPAAFDHVATCLAAMCVSEFGLSTGEKSDLMALKERAESSLRTIARRSVSVGDMSMSQTGLI